MGDKLTEQDVQILKDSIAALRRIQVEFVDDANSLRRFDIMFREKKKSDKKTVKTETSSAVEVEDDSTSAVGDTKQEQENVIPMTSSTDKADNDVVVEVKEASEDVAQSDQSDESQKLIEI